MNDFDRLLELQLRRKLDPIVAAPVPARRGRPGNRRADNHSRFDTHIKSIGGMPIELRPDALAFVERS
jgi:hypothetical protein